MGVCKCPVISSGFIFRWVSAKVDRTDVGVEEVRAIRGHPSSLKAKHPTGARQPEGIRGSPQTPINPCAIRGHPRVRRHPQSRPSPESLGIRVEKLRTPLFFAEGIRGSGKSATPRPGNGEASCATTYRTLGLQRPENTEGPRPRYPGIFPFPPPGSPNHGGRSPVEVPHRERVPERGVAEARRRRGVRPFSARSPGLMLFMGVRRSHR